MTRSKEQGASSKKAGTRPRFRKPTEDEQILMRFAAKSAPRGKVMYARQLINARVRFSCECGCPSFFVQASKEADVTKKRYEVWEVGVATYSHKPAPAPCWAIVFVKDGRLHEIELAPMNQTPLRGSKLLELADSHSVLYSAKEAA